MAIQSHFEKMMKNPIELKFILGVVNYLREEGATEDRKHLKNIEDFQKELRVTCSLSVEPQHPVGIYIVDFYFWDDKTNQKYAVEIDGHEAHKTKEQRFDDYRRERFLMKEGYKVIRFMGSEIYTDAVACFKAILDIIEADRAAYECMSCANAFRGQLSVMCPCIETTEQKKILKNALTNAYNILPPLDFFDIISFLKQENIDWQEVKDEW